MTEDQIKRMAERFLGWKLPEDFHPDAGIKFEPHVNPGATYDHTRDGPTGTNLFNYTQAVEMVRHMIEGLNTLTPDLTERAAIVAWLRKQDGHGYDDMRADLIEAGEHHERG